MVWKAQNAKYDIFMSIYLNVILCIVDSIILKFKKFST